MNETSTLAMSHHLKPRCPRDNRIMHYEPEGIRWKDASGKIASLPSYHCNYTGCSVRYDVSNGYFTVILEPDVPYFVEEPATNQMRCPRHGAWLFRELEDLTDRFILRCGVEGCSYVHADPGGIWLRE
jgi:hypothetical protein